MADHRPPRGGAQPRERGARRLGRPLVARRRDRAVTALRHGLGRDWPLYRRRAALTEASFLLAAQAERFARLISTEGCKTVVEADREVARAVETLRLSGECADALTGETLPLDNTERGAGRIGWFVRAPVGIVAAITPFNDPLNLVAHKLGPALLAGNGVILKPLRPPRSRRSPSPRC